LKACIDACRGQYIAICEGDDYWIDEYKLNKQYEILLKNPDAVLFGRFYKRIPETRLNAARPPP